MTRTHTAYLGCQDLKRSTLQRASALVGDQKIVATRKPTLAPESGIGSPFAALQQSVDYEALEVTLGIPVLVASLYEAVFASFIIDQVEDGQYRAVTPASAAAGFPLWLEALPAGADLNALPSRFVAELLEALARADQPPFSDLCSPLPEVLSRVARLHRQGDATPAQWHEVRRVAVRATDTVEGYAKLVSQLAETVAWPVEEAPEELLAAVSALIAGVRWRAAQGVYTAEEVAIQTEAQETVERLRKAGHKVTPETVGQFPELQAYEHRIPAERGPQSVAASNAAGQHLGQFLHGLLVRVTAG